MIETIYGLKYHFPHSLVHIVDNTMYNGTLPVVIADDPSLMATLVVSAMPYGEDNVCRTITRSDVLNVAWGNSFIAQSDIKKYGQTIKYPEALINQNVPVRMLRVTPEGSTYGFSSLIAQWYKVADDSDDPEKGFIKIRFLVRNGESSEILTNLGNISQFRNQDRLYKQLVSLYHYNSTEPGADDGKRISPSDDPNADEFPFTHQELLICNIAGGRGRNYNYLANTIDYVAQGKNPPNVAYRFTTFDTRDTRELEKYTAAMVDVNNIKVNKLPDVNTQMGARVPGSSLTKQYVNEEAVGAIFSMWKASISAVIDDLDVLSISESEKSLYKQAYNNTTVNTFDVLFGKFIISGDDNTPLPMYEVKMTDNSIIQLPVGQRIPCTNPDEETDRPTTATKALSAKINGTADDQYATSSITGVKETDPVKIGNIYFNTNGKITLVTGINQFSGGITTLPINYVRKYTGSHHPVETEGVAKYGKLVGVYKNGHVPNAVSTAADTLYGVYDETTNEVTVYYNTDESTSYAYKADDLYRALVFNDAGTTTNAYSNIIGFVNAVTSDTTTTDSNATTGAANKIGGTWIYVDGSTTVEIHVNTNAFVKSAASHEADEFIVVQSPKALYGSAPSALSVDTTFIGTEYDVMFQADVEDQYIYTLTTEVPADWSTTYTTYFTKSGDDYVAVPTSDPIPDWAPDTYYSRTPVVATTAIWRYMVTGTLGSVYQIQKESGIAIPEDYYNEGLYIVPEYTAQNGGVKISGGSTGFFDEYEDGAINSETFKWLYSKLLVDAYRGRIDTRISSTTRVPAKFLFDGGTNTIVGITMLPYMTYSITDIAQASTIFSDEEKQEILLSDDILVDSRISASDDIDVKTAMYDLMIERVYQGMPEEKRPVGPGYGLSLHLDAGECDATTARLVDASFAKKFTNPNASWDIGGYVYNGITYTYVNRLVNNFFTFFRANSINKPYTNSYTAFSEYTSFFPDIDSSDWELRELMYNSGGNVWIPDENNRLVRRSQRTLNREATGTSDIIQESNMRTLSQFCTILQGIIDSYLLEYSDPGVIKTLEEDCNTTFSPWIGDRVQDLSIKFETDTNIDGGDILVCRTGLKFRRLILRAAIIVDLQRRDS